MRSGCRSAQRVRLGASLPPRGGGMGWGGTDTALDTVSLKRLAWAYGCARKGSRRAYAHLEECGGWESQVTPALAEFIAQRDSFYLATANAAGQPYIQHRGGPPGFLHVLDEQTA